MSKNLLKGTIASNTFNRALGDARKMINGFAHDINTGRTLPHAVPALPDNFVLTFAEKMTGRTSYSPYLPLSSS